MIVREDTYDKPQARNTSLKSVLKILNDLGARQVFIKRLAPNDNSKNQPYFGAHLTDLPFIPTGELVASQSVSAKTSDPKRKIKYQAPLSLAWVDAEGRTYPAPNAKLIYYPQYPEVRFSGFLLGSSVNVSEWMDPYKQGRSLGRWLILGVTPDKNIFSYLATPNSALSRELENTELVEISNVFGQVSTIHLAPETSTRTALINKLAEIHNMGWIPSQKLNSDLSPSPYKAQNGGGYTLEAQLGVAPNGIAEPDYLGWEVKQFGVTKFPATGAKPTTLMTPEPNGGIYNAQGAATFVRQFGYPDKSGILDRLNFGGKHIVGSLHNLTTLTMKLTGFDVENSVITNASGAIILVDRADNIAASWSFAKVMDHWKRKHSQAVYIPCLRRKHPSTGFPEYHYGKDIELGTGTNFEIFLSAMNRGGVFYDPGIKLENASSEKPRLKLRSQFRVNHKHLDTLYKKFEFVDISSQ